MTRLDRGLSFIDRPGGDATKATTVIDHPSGPRLSVSPGRVDPLDPAWEDSRKALVGEFRMRSRKVFVIANHFASKGGDDPLFGRLQPPTRSSEVQRHAQAQVVNDFVDEILTADPHANVIVLGDINDFEFSETVEILEGGMLTTLMDTLPKPERYSYVFEGNSQVLDQVLVSDSLLDSGIDYDPVHVNSEFADQASDHDPQVARLDLKGGPLPGRQTYVGDWEGRSSRRCQDPRLRALRTSHSTMQLASRAERRSAPLLPRLGYQPHGRVATSNG